MEESAETQETQRIPLTVAQSRILQAPWPVRRVSVTDPAVADVQVLSPRRVQLQGKASGSTDITFWSESEEIWQGRVDVTADVSDIAAELDELFPRARLEVRQIRDTLIVRGVLGRAEHAQQLEDFLLNSGVEKYLNMTSVAGVQQVQLKVRVAEVSRNALQTLGINAFYGGDDFFGGIPLGSSAGPFVPMNPGIPAGTPATSTVFEHLSPIGVPPSATLFAGFPGADLEIFIQALAENQYLKLLAEPTLVALSGEEASFLAGGEFPIPFSQGGESDTVTIEFKEFGVRLGFRPVVLGDGSIRLEVAPEVSELSDVGAVVLEGFRIPALVTRRVETTVELKSGQTFAMAGLISQSTSTRVSQIPGLGDIPVLGPLFRNTRYQRGETELVVIVTASLVEPLSTAGPIPVPGDLHIPPSPWEFYVEGRIEGKAPPRLSPKQMGELKRRGLDRLRGPGAWVAYENQVPASTARQQVQ